MDVNKLMKKVRVDRKYINKPDEGISLALHILNSKTDDFDIYAKFSATCYLGYRALDGKYHQVEFIWKLIQDNRNFILSGKHDMEKEYQVRWGCSLTILMIYFKLIFFKEKEIPLHLLDYLCNVSHVKIHPNQVVNIVRGCSLMMLYHFIHKNEKEYEKYYYLAINIFFESCISYASYKPEFPDVESLLESNPHIIHELVETVEVLEFNKNLKNCEMTSEKFLEIKKSWDANVHHFSTKYFYKCLIEINNIYNT